MTNEEKLLQAMKSYGYPGIRPRTPKPLKPNQKPKAKCPHPKAKDCPCPNCPANKPKVYRIGKMRYVKLPKPTSKK